MTNALLACLDEATHPALTEAGRWASFKWVCDTHAALGMAMGLPPAAYTPVAESLEDLRRLLEGIHLTGETSPRLRARVAAKGELLSSQLGLAFLRARGGCAVTRVDARALLTSHVGEGVTVADSDRYLEADVRPGPQVERGAAAAEGAPCVITQGFIASTPEGATCLLGRGGSDTSGALFAALIGAARLEIWTDVNGMFTADPRYVPRARLIRSLTYREAQELAACGARVLHPRCLLPAAFCAVPVQVRNTMDAGDEAEITTISSTGQSAVGVAAAAGTHAGSIPTPLSLEGSSEAAAGAQPLPPQPPQPQATSLLRVLEHVRFDGGGAQGGRSGSGSGRGESQPGGLLQGGAGAVWGGDSPISRGSQRSESSTPTPSPLSPESPSLFGLGVEEGSSGSGAPAPKTTKVLAVARRKGVTLLSMSTYDMWGNAGFLGRVFTAFGAAGVSVDLIATSQYAVSVTLDHIPEPGLAGEPFARLLRELTRLCTVSVRHPCAVVSVVGRHLRCGLPSLGSGLRALAGCEVYMVSAAAEDLSLSFVVDEGKADGLVQGLHAELLEGSAMHSDAQFGPVWHEMPCGRSAIPGEAKH